MDSGLSCSTAWALDDRVRELVETHGATSRFARVKPNALGVPRADGFLERLGAEHIHGTFDRAVEAQLDG